jgi:RNA polymerase primary sigma factor
VTPEARSAVGRPTRAQRRRIDVKGDWAVTLVHEPGGGDHGSGALAGAPGEALVSAAWRSRLADRELAAELQRPEPAGPAVSSRCLEELERRARLPQALERELIAAAQAGDAHARARLVEAFLPLVASVARVYRDSPRVERLELLQEGVVGLLRALQRFDPDRGVPFWGYAVWWVRQAMQQLVSELTRPVVLSDRALRQLARLKDAHRKAVAATGREPSRRELIELSGLEADHVDDLLAVDQAPRSLDETIRAEDGVVGTFGELLADPLAEGEYERVLEAFEAQELLALLGGLSERERQILRARHGLDGSEQSLRQVAGNLGLSAERVRQLEQRALGKLAAVAAPKL